MHVISVVVASILSACSDHTPPDVAVDREKEAAAKAFRREIQELPSTIVERVLWTPAALSEQAFYDFIDLTNSTGDTVPIWVQEGETYRVKIILWPGENQKIIHDQTVTAKSDRLTVGLFCSLAYAVTETAIEVDPKKEWLILEIDGETFAEEVPAWGYRPEEFISKTIFARKEEKPFLVLFHYNNMGPNSFEMAAESAYHAAETVIATIQEVPESGEQDAADQPPALGESEAE